MNYRNVFFTGIMAAALLGCVINPESPAIAGEDPSAPGRPAKPVSVAQEEEFTVTLVPNGDGAAAGADGISLSVAGPAVETIRYGAIRNVAQAIVLDTAGNVVSFSQARRTNDAEEGANLGVNVTTGNTYHFLVLMGHQERNYAGEANPHNDTSPYQYTNDAPTLLAAGFKTQTVTGEAIKITMKPLVVDTVFRYSGNEKGAALEGVRLPPVPATVTWTLTGAGFDTLLDLPAPGSGTSGIVTDWGDLPFKSIKTVVRGDGINSGNDSSATASLGGAYNNQITLNIENYTTGRVGKSGSANFNLQYAPFGLTDSAKWGGFEYIIGQGHNEAGVPLWIIRNGVNDKAQNANTTFPAPTSASGTSSSPWNGTEAGKANGNGAAVFTVVTEAEAVNGITTIVDYNLQHYVPVPATGAVPVTEINRPDMTVVVAWTDTSTSPTTAPAPFAAGHIYTAVITLTAKDGYAFDGAIPFAYPAGTINGNLTGTNTGTTTRTLNVTYKAAEAPAPIGAVDLTNLILKPVTGGTPVTSFSAGTYSGTVLWYPSHGIFAGNTTYTATVTLTPAQGYAFAATSVTVTYSGISINAFTTGGDTATRSGTITFPVTDAASSGDSVVTDLNLTYQVEAPGNGHTVDRAVSTIEYGGQVTWYKGPDFDPPNNPYTSDKFVDTNTTAYKAVAVLTAKDGYTFTGMGNFFHNAPNCTVEKANNTGDKITVTITFPSSGPIAIATALFSGDVNAHGDSAIDAIKANVSQNTLSITLSGGTGTEPETVTFGTGDIGTGLVLTYTGNAATDTSPAGVIIDGANLTVDLTGSAKGTLITVGSGVTLTLKNITIKDLKNSDGGSDPVNNNVALIKVDTGGMLILGKGAVIRDNYNTYGQGGGVHVASGGKFIMDGEAEIAGNTVWKPGPHETGGGVYVAGKFTMTTGKINGNVVSGSDGSGGGGVYVAGGGEFLMDGGEIRGNTADNSNSDPKWEDNWPSDLQGSGAGVFVAHGNNNIAGGKFIMTGGVIAGNIAYYRGHWQGQDQHKKGGGGVFLVARSDDDKYKDAYFKKTGGTIYGSEQENGANANHVYKNDQNEEKSDGGAAISHYTIYGMLGTAIQNYYNYTHGEGDGLIETTDLTNGETPRTSWGATSGEWAGITWNQ